MRSTMFYLTLFAVILGLAGSAGAALGDKGNILFEWFNSTKGSNLNQAVDGRNANYPDKPSDIDYLTALQGPTNRANTYLTHVRGYIYPPETGEYTFWTSSDDHSRVWLSTDADPANMVLIAEVNGSTSALQWDKYPAQKSSPITLQADQKYYIEVLHRDGTGGDHLAVAWGGPASLGAGPVIIDGAFLSPWLRPVRVPVPADGAVDVDTASIEWTAADTAVSHRVYLSKDETIDESDFIGETTATLQIVALDQGTTYYWRVDEVAADASVTQGPVWTFTTLPFEAHFPSPADAATDVALDAKLGWVPGKNAILHNVYFGTDPTALAPVAMMQVDPSFDPGPLQPFGTYYWRVDEFAPGGTVTGPVWSFSTIAYISIADVEATINYDNTIAPFFTETLWNTPQDLTYGGVAADMTLRVKGRSGPGDMTVDAATGTYSVTGAGADVWNKADEFHFAYLELTGDATIVARVVDIGTGSNRWAKGGVMIRQSLDADSANIFGAISGGDGNGGTFQWRPTQGASSDSSRTLTVAPPYWVRLTRIGNSFTCEMSADGQTWEQEGAAPKVPVTATMMDPVLIGLAVTSHQAYENRTFVFDNVSIVGNVSAVMQHQDINVTSNAAAPLYAVLQDSTGASAVVTHPDAAITQNNQWTDWRIPLAAFSNAGVNPTAAVNLYVGVGDRNNPTPGGSGVISIDDIRTVKAEPPAQPAEVTP